MCHKFEDAEASSLSFFILLLRLAPAEDWRRELSVLMRRARTQQTRQISYMCARSFGQFELMVLCVMTEGKKNCKKDDSPCKNWKLRSHHMKTCEK